MESNKIGVVIPAFNEEKTIQLVINKLTIALEDLNVFFIVVNDFSSDNTSYLAKESGAIVIDLEKNKGYSKAIEMGLNFCCYELQCDYVVTVDADGQHKSKDVKEIVDYAIQNNMDCIVGNRIKKARLGEVLYGVFFRTIFGVKDPLCGLKVYKLDFYRLINTFETYDSIGTELMTRYLLSEKKVHCIDIDIDNRLDEPRFGSGFKVNLRIIKSLAQSSVFILKEKITNN